jgi:BolA family transcriptional regulator, general stress-responsive regulator
VSRKERIESLLRDALAPDVLEVENESHQHSVKAGSETHFRVVVVSKSFEGLPLVGRHRKINQALSPEFKLGLHALTMHPKTPEEWSASPLTLASPACLGGSKHKSS